MIYERDWISAADDPENFNTELGTGGLRNFKQMIDALPTVAGPIVIEPTSHVKLDREQRQELDVVPSGCRGGQKQADRQKQGEGGLATQEGGPRRARRAKGRQGRRAGRQAGGAGRAHK